MNSALDRIRPCAIALRRLLDYGAISVLIAAALLIAGAEAAFNPAGLVINGDPASPGGATWNYVSTDEGIHYQLSGILFKPAGEGPFPAIIISHGRGGSATHYSRKIAREMVQWGAVVIATNYTHAATALSVGSPGEDRATDYGASEANVLRAHKCWDILAGLGYVDMTRVAAHGHSMGAFVTAALVGAYPQDFRVASHTAGGMINAPVSANRRAAAPTPGQVAGITVPYQIHHGDADRCVLQDKSEPGL